jgi:hypothetical protein
VRLSIPWARPIATGLVVLTALGCAAPAFSAEPASSSAGPSTSLAARAAVSVAKLEPTPRALLQETPAPAATGTTDSPRSFFRSRAGIAAIVLMVAGAGYVAYSIPKDNEKVHSPIR